MEHRSRYLILLAVLLMVNLAACNREQPSRVILLGIDGLDPLTIDLLLSEGELPNFARLRQGGAYGRLISQKPMLSPILWTTIATGKGPEDHGIGHFVAIHPETGEQTPVTSRMRRVKALWNLASEAGKTVATVGWWATWPPEEIAGSVVSDRTAYHFLFQEGLTGGRDEVKTYPVELFKQIKPLMIEPEDLTADDLSTFVRVSPEELERPFDFENELAHFRWALATARSYRDIGLELWRKNDPELLLVYIEGVDSTSHLFGHLFRARDLGGELAEQQVRYGDTVEQMYHFADRILGQYLDALDERTTLVVLSDHGFELGALHDDPSKTRDLRRVSEQFHRLEGILYLYGHRVPEGVRIDRPQLVDITPTVLSLLGLPAAADMPGRILTEALTFETPSARIPTYEDGTSSSTEPAADSVADPALLEHLKSLGYLGGSETDVSPQGDRNLAAIHFQNGNYREAARLYSALITENPEDAGLRTSLAGVLGAVERYDEAMEQLNLALELSPLNVEAYHNRAVIHERRGDRDKAVADYTSALRYRPDYEPSQKALLRLTGNAQAQAPADAAEAQAARLAEEASQLARRGQYQRAMELLDEAQSIAPKFGLVYQYRSNVAYLMGDREAAIEALRQGLDAEPDNALFRENLRRLTAEGG